MQVNAYSKRGDIHSQQEWAQGFVGYEITVLPRNEKKPEGQYSYYINYDANGGTIKGQPTYLAEEVSNKTLILGPDVPVLEEVPVRESYDFLFWYYKKTDGKFNRVYVSPKHPLPPDGSRSGHPRGEVGRREETRSCTPAHSSPRSSSQPQSGTFVRFRTATPLR